MRKGRLAQKAAASSLYLKERNYWLNQLSGELKKSCFPDDFQEDRPGSGRQVAALKFTVSPAIALQLLKLSNGSDPRLLMILIAAFVVLLEKYLDNSDIILGTSIYKQAEHGEFINTLLPLRNQVQQNCTFKQLLLQVRQTLVAACENQNYPIEILLYHLDMEFSETDFPLFDMMILLENIQDRQYIRNIKPGMLFSFLRTDDRIGAVVEYQTSRYRQRTIEKVVEYFIQLLQVVLTDINTRILDIIIHPEAERKKLLIEFNQTRQDYPDDKTVVQLFEEQVQQSADKIAVVWEESHNQSPHRKHLTFRELSARANCLAGILRHKGVQPDHIVGLLVEAGEWVPVGIMGILKAGGAYLPIDTKIPTNRMASMLNDCNPSFLLTSHRQLKDHPFTALQHLQGEPAAVQLNPPRPPIPHLDQLPIPNRSLVNYEKYNQYIGQALVKNSIALQATRGCPYNCAYCHKIWSKKQVVRSAENIFDEIRLYYNMGVKRFAFIDDIFNLDTRNSTRFFELLIENRVKVHLFFPNGMRGDILTREYIDLMVEAGVVDVALALETASPRLQQLIGKRLQVEKLQENIDYLCQKYPHVILELFTMHGFPSETTEEALKTLEFIKRLKWAHFPYVNILKIYHNTEMEKLALKQGVSMQAILRSENLAHHQLPETLPFDKQFTIKYQADFLNDYFLLKERLLHVLPYQMKILSQDEIVQKYNSYLPTPITTFAGLLEFLEIRAGELTGAGFIDENLVTIKHFNRELREHFPAPEPGKDALKVLLLDLSQLFSGDSDMLYDVVEPPLGLLYLMTYLKKQLGNKINGKIAKSRIDFDNYSQLRALVEEFKPEVIGVRTLIVFKDFFHQTIAVLRGWGLDVPIVAGGPYATSSFDLMLQDRNIDLAVLGEGEETFTELVNEIIKNNRKIPPGDILKEIRGIAFVAGRNDSAGTFARELIQMDQEGGVLSGRNSQPRSKPLPNVNQPTDLVYTIFTSGSAGKPKCVGLTHRNLVNYVSWFSGKTRLSEIDKTMLLSSFAFDLGYTSLYSSLVKGGELHILPREMILSPEHVLGYLKENQISYIKVTPSLFSLLVDSPGFSSDASRELRLVVLGGEAINLRDVEKARGICNHLEVMNHYGPTEGTIGCIVHMIDFHRFEEYQKKPVIGKPIHNVKIYIVGRRLTLMPLGAAGELCISGVCLGRGYLNNPGLTVERFLYISYESYRSYRSYIFKKHPPGRRRPRGAGSLLEMAPLSPDLYPGPYALGSRLYKTGDLGRWLKDGTIEFLGRTDHQVKVRGYRVELGEIENQLTAHPGIKEAVVIAKETAKGDRYLCAYLVPEVFGNSNLEAADTRSYLLEKMPEYMIPGYFVKVEEIPLNSNGKVERKALPGPEMKTGPADTGPRSRLERILANIWSEVLFGGDNRRTISIQADFFELGGHSLKAIMLVSQIQKELLVKIPLAQIFKCPTILGLAEYIKKTAHIQDRDQSKYTSIEPVEKREYYDVSSAQMRMYILQQMDTGSTGYNKPYVMVLEGNLAAVKLESIFIKLIRRHESLRTSFEMKEGKPVQRIHDELEFEIEYKKVEVEVKVEEERSSCFEGTGGLAPLPIDPTARNSQLATRSSQPAAALINSFIRPFDLSQTPLVRVGLINAAEAQYILIVDMHHITSDGTSMGTFVNEFIQLYKGKCLPLLRLQYKDFARWQNREKEKGGFKQHERYWLKQFAGEIPVLDLPIDYARPGVQSFEGNHVKFEIKQEATEQLKKLATGVKTTLYMVILAIYNVLLWKLSHQEDFVVGTPVVGRHHADLKNIIGMFANTLALRNFITPEMTFKTFLKNLGDQTLEAFDNQDYQFEDLVEKVQVQRHAGRNPIFDVMFVLQDIDIPGIEIPGLKLKPYEYEGGISKFDLTLTGEETGSTLSFAFEYCRKLFKQETIERFVLYFKNIMSGVLENADEKLSDLEIISPGERELILQRFNDIPAVYPGDKSIHRLFEEQVWRTPHKIAVVGTLQLAGDFDAALTYRELNRQSNRLAYTLLEKSVRYDTIVGIMMERSVEMIVGIMGILKSGGAYLPIDPGYPPERITYMLKDSNATILLATEDTENTGGMASPTYYCSRNTQVSKEKSWDEYKNSEGSNTEGTSYSHLPIFSSSHLPAFYHLHLSPAPVTSLAYIIYTSGTTGLPKGVLIEHKNVVQLLFNNGFQFGFNETDVWTLFHSFCFDFSVWEMYGALLYGGGLVIIPKTAARDTAWFLKVLKKERVTVLNQTPSAFYHLMDEELKYIDKQLNIKYVIFGGEALKPGKLREWKNRYPGTKLINMYGITETTVHVTFKEITAADIDAGISNVGKPLPTLNIYIMDRYLKFSPPGLAGECCVGGAGIGRGYLNRPYLTREKFIKNPYRPGERLYRSGDLAKLLVNNEIEYLGRIDKQVKIRGFRIEPREIEIQLLSHHGVKEALVIPRRDKQGDTNLCCYWVEKPGVNPKVLSSKTVKVDTSELRTHLAGRLPDYMIPSYFVQLPGIPLTPNGKIDYQALPGPGFKAIGDYAAPRGGIERKLVEIWSEVLYQAYKPLGIDDNFFELGGHSLKAVRISNIIHKELNIKLPLVEIFKHSTIRELAAALERMPGFKYVSIQAAEKKEYYPLSSAQRRLYVLQQFESDSIGYNLPMAFILDGKLNKEILERTFKGIIEKYESFRTSFVMVKGKPVQRIHDQLEFEIEYKKVEVEEEQSSCLEGTGGLAPLPIEPATALISSFIRPFDISQAPILRVALHQLGRGKYLLLTDMHHIISDGISQGIIVKESMRLYRGESLVPLRIDYKDYSLWQQGVEGRKAIKSQKKYWLEVFSGDLPLLQLPVDYQRPVIKSFEGSQEKFEITKELYQGLKHLALKEKTTLFMVLVSLYTLILSRLSGQEDIIIGTPAAGRRHPDLDQAPGFFVNTLALRSYPNEAKAFKTFLKETKEFILEAFENQDYPFEELVESVSLPRDVGRNPVFDVMFVLQNFEVPQVHIPGLTLKPYEFDRKTSKFDLTLTAVESSGTLQFVFEYSTRLFKNSTIQRFITYFKTIICAVLENMDKKLSGIDIIPGDERQLLLHQFNNTGEKFPGHMLLHRLFEEQVKKTPDSIVVVGIGPGLEARRAGKNMMQITSRELNRKSDQLAGWLKQKGAAVDTIIAIMAERSPEVIVGILGILKAGSAYLPIEPAYPRERIDFILKDSGANILLKDNDFTSKALNNRPGGTSLSPSTFLPRCSSNSSNLAYIIYTSGSSGKPKGTLVEHHSVVNLAITQKKRFKIDKHDGILQFSSLCFDASVEQIFISLFSSARLILVDKEILLDRNQFEAYILKHLITHLHAVPSFLNHVRIGPSCHLRRIISGGDICPASLVEKWCPPYSPGYEFYNEYGPTETTVTSIMMSIREIESSSSMIPIGKPIGNTTVYLVDNRTQPVPLGVAGELYIGGEGVSRGYLNQPELTAGRFIYSPQLTGERLYRTGDLGRWLPNGDIEFLGRQDHQVKIRGFRIELEEIESQLLKHEDIKNAAVISSNEDSGDKYLCAYIIPVDTAQGKLPGSTELREYLSDVLPDYMVPSYFIELEKMPRTASGKVDKRALSHANITKIKAGSSYEAPGNESESMIADIWAKVLGVDKVGVNDNFFAIGGNSLHLIQVTGLLPVVFGKAIPVVTMFRYPTIRSILQYMKKEEEGDIPLNSDRSEVLRKGKTRRTQLRQKKRNQGVASE